MANYCHDKETSLKIWESELKSAESALNNPKFKHERHKIERAIERAKDNIAKLKME